MARYMVLVSRNGVLSREVFGYLTSLSDQGILWKRIEEGVINGDKILWWTDRSPTTDEYLDDQFGDLNIPELTAMLRVKVRKNPDVRQIEKLCERYGLEYVFY